MPNLTKKIAVLILLAASVSMARADIFNLYTLNGNTSLSYNIATSFKSAPGLQIVLGSPITIYGWQGSALGGTASGQQLLLPNPGLVTGQEITNVVFDLASNKVGPSGSSYDPVGGSQYDYAEWIADPTNSSLDELVPYAAVPEPTTILAALLVLGAVAYRERRRFAFLGSFSKPQSCS